VVDDDETFRQRVAKQLSEEEVGEAGRLWLTRPDGWENRLDELRKQQQQQDHAAHEEKAERGSQRRLAGAEERARRAELSLTVKTREVEEARAALANERTLRTHVEDRLDEVTATIDELRSDRNAAVRQLKDVESELAQRTADLRHARHEIRMREAELEQAMASRAAAEKAMVATRQSAVSAPPAPGTSPAAEPSATEDRPAPETDKELLVARAELASVVAEAAAGAERLAASLAAAAQLLTASDPGAAMAASTAATRPQAQQEPRHAPRRSPVRLPPGTTDDSSEAADHLLRMSGALLLVDGYNVSHALWWDQPIAVQRERLVNALAELHARTGVDVEVVFDGADVPRGPAGAPRPAVRVRFSPPGVEADDVILELVASVTAARPVIVASSDRRVRDGARRQGANVLGARQLAGALRR
jgi:predicted RNA-binding protein with PIN domain